MTKSLVTDSSLILRRRKQIYEAAVELFALQGYFRTTIQDIAQKAGVSTGLIYQYCKDKDDVLLLVLLRVVDAYKTEIPRALEMATDPLVRFKVAVDAYCRIVDSRRKETLLAYRSTKSLPPEKRTIIMEKETESNKLIADCIKDCIKANVFRKVNVDIVTYQIVMFAHTWALKHWFFRKRVTIDDYIKEGLSFFLAALQVEPEARRPTG